MHKDKIISEIMNYAIENDDFKFYLYEWLKLDALKYDIDIKDVLEEINLN